MLRVMARGSAAHGYQLRAVDGAKKSVWLKVTNGRVVLIAALRPGQRPSLTRAH